MRLIVDANILFAALIKESKTSELLLSDRLDLYAPTFLFKEFEKYKSVLLDKTKRDEQAFISFITIIRKYITLIAKEEIRKNVLRAKNISPDPHDEAYFAAAIAKNANIWSNDKRLKEQKKSR